MNKKLKGTLIWFIFGFIIIFLFSQNVDYSFIGGVIGIFIFFLVESGELNRFFEHLRIQDVKRKENRIAWEREQARLRNIRIEEREREVGRREGIGEYYRRENEKIRQQDLHRKRQAENKRRFDNAFRLGRGR